MNISEPDPQQLLTLARNEREQFLGQLLELYRGYLKVLANVQIDRRLLGKADASDIVQETFLEAYRDFPQFYGATQSELMAWLRQILAHNIANLYRRYSTQGRDLRLERQLQDEMRRTSSSMNLAAYAKDSTPSAAMARREQAVLIADALQELPPHYRQVLLLRQLEGLTLPQVAERMDRTTDSVKKLWARAVPRFRKCLEEVLK